MTTPTDTAKLADKIEALAKDADFGPDASNIDDLVSALPLETFWRRERALVALVNNHATIIAALRELEAAHAREAKLREALEPFAADAALWDGPDSLPLVEAAPGYSDALTVGDLRRARAALGGAG